MKEKEEDENEEDMNENENGENIISTNTKKKKLNLINEIEEEPQKSKENLLSEVEEQKIFECELIYKNKINKINLIINQKKYNIEIRLFLASNNQENSEKSSKKEENEDFISLKTINQIDFISFMSQEDISEIKINEIKNTILNINNKNENENENKTENKNLLNDKEICSITSFPSFSKSECNFCKCLFCCECSCRKNYKIKEFTTDYFLIKTEYIIQIKKCIFNISLPKLHELQAKNRKRKILAFVNPIGGKGNALILWEKAKTILNQGYLDIDTIITKQFREVYNYMLTLDPMKYDGFITCSGDGIPHEIINAIFHRNEEDKNKFLEHCAICPLPAGSGNALSKAISSYCGDDNRIETHCYYICKGIKKKIDVQEMQLKGLEKKIYSVIAFMYGFLADCDLESEFFRCLGMSRTTIWGTVRYFFLRDYIGTLYYLPEDASEEVLKKMPNLDENINDVSKYGLIKLTDQFNIFITNNIKYISEDITPHPLSELDDGYSDLFMLPQSKGGGRCSLLRYLISDMDPGNLFTDENKTNLKSGYEYHKTKWWRLIPKKATNDPDDVNQEQNWTNNYSIDGERYPIRPIQCCTLNKIFNIYSGKE